MDDFDRGYLDQKPDENQLDFYHHRDIVETDHRIRRDLEGEIQKFRDRLSALVTDHFDLLLHGQQGDDPHDIGVVPDTEYPRYPHSQVSSTAAAPVVESQSQSDEMSSRIEKDLFSFQGVKRDPDLDPMAGEIGAESFGESRIPYSEGGYPQGSSSHHPHQQVGSSQESQESVGQLVETLRMELEISDLVLALVVMRENILAS